MQTFRFPAVVILHSYIAIEAENIDQALIKLDSLKKAEVFPLMNEYVDTHEGGEFDLEEIEMKENQPEVLKDGKWQDPE